MAKNIVDVYQSCLTHWQKHGKNIIEAWEKRCPDVSFRYKSVDSTKSPGKNMDWV